MQSIEDGNRMQPHRREHEEVHDPGLHDVVHQHARVGERDESIVESSRRQ